MGVFVAFVVLTIAANWSYLLDFAGVVAGVTTARNALAFGGGYAIATYAKRSHFDCRSVTIETGIQNSGLGPLLISTIFGGLGGMAIVATFWGIWHAISGIIIAMLMSRTKAAR